MTLSYLDIALTYDNLELQMKYIYNTKPLKNPISSGAYFLANVACK